MGGAIHYNRTMALKVFDLQCDGGHVFEGWFSSHDDYHQQQDRGLLTCPVCDSRTVVRQVSAARINRGVAGPTEAAVAPRADVPGGVPPPLPPEMQAELLRRLRAAVRAADDVGSRFADEARAIHQGQAPERAIRGVATVAEREALAEEGIAAIPLPGFINDDSLH